MTPCRWTAGVDSFDTFTVVLFSSCLPCSGGRTECPDRLCLVPEGRCETLFPVYGFRSKELLQREVFRRLQTSLLQTKQGELWADSGWPPGSSFDCVPAMVSCFWLDHWFTNLLHNFMCITATYWLECVCCIFFSFFFCCTWLIIANALKPQL